MLQLLLQSLNFLLQIGVLFIRDLNCLLRQKVLIDVLVDQVDFRERIVLVFELGFHIGLVFLFVVVLLSLFILFSTVASASVVAAWVDIVRDAVDLLSGQVE